MLWAAASAGLQVAPQGTGHGVALGDEQQAEQAYAPLRALGPQVDTLRLTPASRLVRLHLDPPMLDDRVDARMPSRPGVHERISAVRRAVDPDALFLAQHGSPTAR